MDKTAQRAPLNLMPGEPERIIADPQNADEAYRASLNATLSRNIGYYVICEFLIGTSNLVVRDGTIYSVGNNFITLYQAEEDRYVVCDIYSLKFITFYDSRTRPRYVRVPRNIGY